MGFVPRRGGDSNGARTGVAPSRHRCHSFRQEKTKPLAVRGLDACRAIVGVDFPSSNRTSSATSVRGEYNAVIALKVESEMCVPPGQRLHGIHSQADPYIDTLVAIDSLLSARGNKQSVLCYGVSDVAAGTERVFSLFRKNKPAPDFDYLVARYEQLAPLVELATQTSFAPLIKQAILEVYRSGMVFHVLFILSDGQVSKEGLEETKEAMILASDFPLFIVMIGVGDGPWEKIESLTEFMPQRPRLNCHFVEPGVLFSGVAPGIQQKSSKRLVSTILSAIEAHFMSWQDNLKDQVNNEWILAIVGSISSDLSTGPFQFH